MGVPVYRDIEHKTNSFFFTLPISEKGYLLGRFCGSFIILALIFTSVALGIITGSLLGPLFGTVKASQLGPIEAMYYIAPFFTLMVPNLLLSGAIFFALVALTRNIFSAYVGNVVLLVSYILTGTLLSNLDNRTMASLLDAFGLRAISNAARYWTIAEQNTLIVPFTGEFLYNRLIWLGVSLLLLAFTVYRFDFQRFLAENKGSARKKDKLSSKHITASVRLDQLPKVQQLFSTMGYLKQSFSLAWLEFSNAVKEVYFIAIMSAGVILMLVDAWYLDEISGTPSLPVTFLMLSIKNGNFFLFSFIIIIFYTGEMVYRDRSLRFANISDAFPVPNWMLYTSKFMAIVYVCVLLTTSIMLVGIFMQTIKGYFNYEFNLYFKELYLITLPYYIQLAALSFFIQLLINNKFAGYVGVVVFWLIQIGFQSANYDFNMVFYGNSPGYVYSDMNGYGHFVSAIASFHIYWLLAGLVLLLIGNLFWNRGIEGSFKERLRIARARLNTPMITGLTLALTGFAAMGGWVYYNTNILNKHVHYEKRLDTRADFEKAYHHLERVLQPKMTDVKFYADLFPEERRLQMRVLTTMTNKWERPIDTLYVNFSHKILYLKINNQALEPFYKDSIAFSQSSGEKGGFWWYLMPQTLHPGDTVIMEFAEEIAYRGFPNEGYGREVIFNGTFTSPSLGFGYSGNDISSDKEREKRGLPERQYSQPPQDDPWGLGNLLFNDDADYITYEAILSTSPDQTAISPGYLQKTWEENGRKYFHYKMDSEMDNLFNIVSARYAVAKDVWQGPQGQKVDIEIYHHHTHTYNVERFIASVKASMDYFNQHFTPYQYRQMRIMEFPRYASFAQSFPNTVPYSEAFGWIGDFSKPDNTDYCFFVTAHEVAHQWWGHQVTPSNTRGANQLSESLAEYSALMVLQKEYGKDAMQKFLKYSLDRYLAGRSGESKFEETLMQNDTRAYVWYYKGSLVMYALADYLGEENVNRALKNFLDTAAFRPKAPFATTGEFLPYLKAVTPDSLLYFVEDSWEKIALYENRITKASYKPLGQNDEYRVKLTVMSKKIYYDGKGEEIGKGTGKDLIEIGIFAEDVKNNKGMTVKNPLYLKKHWLGEGEHVLEFTIKGKPIRAGIDPYNKLIDRVTLDNVMSISEE
jgi:hypothetical protein